MWPSVCVCVCVFESSKGREPQTDTSQTACLWPPAGTHRPQPFARSVAQEVDQGTLPRCVRERDGSLFDVERFRAHRAGDGSFWVGSLSPAITNPRLVPCSQLAAQALGSSATSPHGVPCIHPASTLVGGFILTTCSVTLINPSIHLIRVRSGQHTFRSVSPPSFAVAVSTGRGPGCSYAEVLDMERHQNHGLT